MKLTTQFISLICLSLVFASGCTKKAPTVNPDKIRGAALKEKQAEDKANLDSATLPEPSADTPDLTAPQPRVVERTPTPGPTLTPNPTPQAPPDPQPQVSSPSIVATPPAPDTAAPPAVATQQKPPALMEKKPEETGLSIFEKCAIEKVDAVLGALENVASAEIKLSQLSATRSTLFEICKIKVEGKASIADLEKVNLARLIAEEAFKRFPTHDSAIRFFKLIEDNANYSREQKEKIYAVYGSGGEISTSGVQFFGKLEGAKSSTNVISYVVTSAVGTRSTRIFSKNSANGTQKNLDLKTLPKTNIRFTFDFTPAGKNLYLLTISDGASKVVADVAFKTGDLKALRERKQVTITLTIESWAKVQEAHLRSLIADQAKDLISMPFSLERKQKDMNLVRTCNLKEESIACTDPDFTINAIVKPSATK